MIGSFALGPASNLVDFGFCQFSNQPSPAGLGVTFSDTSSIILLMSATNDKFEAAKTIVETVRTFDPKEQEMIFRWAAESLGITVPIGASSPASQSASLQPPAQTTPHGTQAQSGAQASVASTQDIKTFVAAKGPKNDVQFAATVAYYYQFLAPKAERKTSITQDDLLDACRKADRQRPPNPYQTLNNAFHLGLLDRPEKGTFSINSVGENLVAMTLPGDTSTPGPKKRAANKKTVRKSAKKLAKKVTKRASAKAKAQKA
jgi:hypothetical protein